MVAQSAINRPIWSHYSREREHLNNVDISAPNGIFRVLKVDPWSSLVEGD